LFNFEWVDNLMDEFSLLPSSTLLQIRHARARGHTSML
jgi:hypothetical protein